MDGEEKWEADTALGYPGLCSVWPTHSATQAGRISAMALRSTTFEASIL